MEPLICPLMSLYLDEDDLDLDDDEVLEDDDEEVLRDEVDDKLDEVLRLAVGLTSRAVCPSPFRP